MQGTWALTHADSFMWVAVFVAVQSILDYVLGHRRDFL